MSDEELRIKLAEVLFGGRWFTTDWGVSYLRVDEDRSKDRYLQQLPNWPADLNACHEVEDRVIGSHENNLYPKHLSGTYVKILAAVVGGVPGCFDQLCASARHRAEALLKTLKNE